MADASFCCAGPTFLANCKHGELVRIENDRALRARMAEADEVNARRVARH